MSLRDWVTTAAWRDWWRPPPKRWWLDPSGTPKPWRWYDYVMETPIGAHTLGAVIAFVIGWFAVTLPRPIAAAMFVLVWACVGQAQKADALLPLKQYNIRNVVWRIIIALVATLLLLVGVAICSALH